jgi:hypothetical protein
MSLCANALENYVNADCEDTFAGGIRSIIVFQDELPEDPSNADQVQALLDNGSAKLLTSLKCGFPEPSPVTSPSMRSCSPERTINYDRTMTLIDANVISGNVDFYNSLNNTTGFEASGLIAHHCDVDRISFITDPIAFEGGLIIPDDNIDQPQHFAYTGKWKSKGDPKLYASPGDIFA